MSDALSQVPEAVAAVATLLLVVLASIILISNRLVEQRYAGVFR